ncbi:hypothetical protein C8F04DRAFT_1271905 [Mycena alexandri]|uniref:CxC5 like cysteine cluster associated with KDZ domain-containing protein n=1 Tax=Mycena alexandri TaxID=1745969 RepID=A0AAD6S8C0_9AGAR|nr:hypothetical protein C8F04DRAFT_1271905 [Mycena alexandri]
MSSEDASSLASNASDDVEPLSLAQSLLFSRLLSVLKRDTVLPQPIDVPTDDAPDILPPTITTFIAAAVGISCEDVTYFWATMRFDIWALSPQTLNEEEEELFQAHGWELGITSLVMHPPSDFCTNPKCGRRKPLKKSEALQIVVYTLASGVVPAWEVHLYCPDCNTTYYPNYSVQHGTRAYSGDIPKYIAIGAHQYAERRLIASWTSFMLVAAVSATNCARTYDMALSGQEEGDFAAGGWQFGCRLTTDHVWDSFILLTLLDYHQRRNTVLEVPHTGDQKDRFTAVMTARNEEVIRMGQDHVVGHCCNKCMRELTRPDGTPYDVQALLSDGLAMGHVRCQVPHCTKYHNSNRDRFCPTHTHLAYVCSIVGCDRPIIPGKKTCDDPKHTEVERLHYERGKAAFTLRDRLQKHRLAHPAGDADLEEPELELADDDIEWFEADTDGNVRVRSKENPGSVGTVDSDACEANKSPEGNQRWKALFGRCRTHNEQILVRPCGVIFARATFYHAEAVSNVLLFVQKACSVPGAFKPEHLIYDTNCDAKQQVLAHPDMWSWFTDVAMTVDVFHFLNKHSVTHTFCQEHCNPAKFPDLMTPDGHWYFNTSIAEQTNVWLGGYHSIVREMLPVKYNFFLDEMIRLRNVQTLAKLAADGHNPRQRVRR